MVAMVAAVAPSGEQLRGERMSLFADNDAVAGALIKASSRIEIISAPIGSFWGCVTQLPAACSVGGVAQQHAPQITPAGINPCLRRRT